MARVQESFVIYLAANALFIVLISKCQVTGEVTRAVKESKSGVKDNRLSLSSLVKQNGEPPTKCGRSSSAYDARIVGGIPASISEYPWMVSLQRESGFWFGSKGFTHVCGGTIITPSWLVTAAHCLYRNEPSRVIAGADNLDFIYGAQIRSVAQTIMHPKFDINTYNNDIGLIRVDQPFVLDSPFSQVGAVCLEKDLPVIPYDIATVCGFGANAFRQRSQSHLSKTDIAIIDLHTCNKSFDGAITSNMICAGGMIAHKRDACSGDSGGPLMMDMGDYKALIGTVSFGNDCATANYPGVYSRLNNYYDWIMSYIDEALPPI